MSVLINQVTAQVIMIAKLLGKFAKTINVFLQLEGASRVETAMHGKSAMKQNVHLKTVFVIETLIVVIGNIVTLPTISVMRDLAIVIRQVNVIAGNTALKRHMNVLLKEVNVILITIVKNGNTVIRQEGIVWLFQEDVIQTKIVEQGKFAIHTRGSVSNPFKNILLKEMY